MQTHRIVKTLDVVDDVVMRGGADGPALHAELLFQCAEETFDDRVIPAVAASAHTGPTAWIVRSRWYAVLAYWIPAIGVVDKAWTGPTRGRGHLERGRGDIHVQGRAQGPANHP